MKENSKETSYDMYASQVQVFYETSKWLNVILITFITAFGLYGNLISIKIFSKSFRKVKNNNNRTTIYFLLLSYSDLFVLVFHYIDFTFRSWINLTGNYSSKFNFVDKCLICCKLIPYFRNSFRTISAYILLIMTLQRFVYLYFPLIRSKVNSTKFNKIIILNIFLISFLLNAGNLFLNILEKHDGNGEFYCNVKKDYMYLQFIFDFLFVSFSILVPTVFIIVFSLILFYRIKSNIPVVGDYYKICCCVSGKLGKKTNIDNNYIVNNINTPNQNKISLNEAKKNNKFNIFFEEKRKSRERESNILNQKKQKCLFFDQLHHHNHHNHHYIENRNNIVHTLIGNKFKTKFKYSIRTTYMLVLVSKWFVILHLPYFICWLIFHLHINSLLNQNDEFKENNNMSSLNETYIYNPSNTLLIKAFLNLFEILFLFNYSIHFILYLINGPIFRQKHSKFLWKFFQNFVFFIFCDCI